MSASEAEPSPYVVVSSPGMEDLAASVLAIMKRKFGVEFPHHRMEYRDFANGEVLPRLPETVRRQHVFFFHPMQTPTPNDALVRLMLANDAMRRASVAGVTLVLPYMTYLRQDRKDRPRVPISARVIADVIEMNRSIERVITFDMHAEAVQGFFSIPVDNLTTISLYADACRRRFPDLSNVLIVAPDFGGVVRARRFAAELGDLPVAIIEKNRPDANKSEVISVIGGPVAGKHIIIYDDMCDTGGTIRGVASELKTRGAKDVTVLVTHGIFSGGAEAKFRAAGFPVLATNTIPRSAAYRAENATWFTQQTMDDVLASAVYQASIVGGSVSQLSTLKGRR
jgi:ribose-phosphate pyrophosphokinase